MTGSARSLAGADFFKVSGGGNDFVALVESSHEPTAEEIRAVCRRGLSVGADGLFLLDRLSGGCVRMRHFNADGSHASLCLNGTRCAARLAFHLGWATGQVTLTTGAGSIRGEDAGDGGTRLHLPPPAAASDPFEVHLELPGAAPLHLEGWRTIVGVPHLVLLWNEALAQAPVDAVGAALVHHPLAGPQGANVNFVALLAPEEPSPESFALRTYERGVDAETLACGTGVMASALCLNRAGRGTFPLSAHTAGGFVFTVDAIRDGEKITAWSLTGDARLVAEGKLARGALLAAPALSS